MPTETPTVIYATGPENATVEIRVEETFDSPWRLIVRRPGRSPYHARCVLRSRVTPAGDPLIDIVWQGKPATPPMRAILERAVSARLEDALPEHCDLVPLPGKTPNAN